MSMFRALLVLQFLLCISYLQAVHAAEAINWQWHEESSSLKNSEDSASGLSTRTSVTVAVTDGLKDESEQSRSLLQLSEATQAEEQEYNCGRQVSRYLEASSRTWILDDAALEALDNDLQAVVNCTQENDVILFDVAKRIRPAGRVTLPWKLTLSAYTENTGLENGIFPRTSNVASFHCPQDNEGVFIIRGGSVLIANIALEKCTFEPPESGAEAIINVDRCEGGGSSGTIQLHHVRFRDNDLTSATGLLMNSPSCSDVELVDVRFFNNTCGGACGAILSGSNALQDVVIKRNVPADTMREPSVMLHAPAGSQTTVQRLLASRNGVAMLEVVAGELDLSDSTLRYNQPKPASDEDARASCIYLLNSSAIIEDSNLRGNDGVSGAVIHSNASTIELRNSSFVNNTARSGGVLYLHESPRVVIESCNFSGNAAGQGGVAFVTGSQFSGSMLNLTNNTASGKAGCFYTEKESSIRLEDSVATSNRAESGGVAALESGSRADLTECELVNNSAVDRGGSVFAEDSDIAINSSRLLEGNAAFGGFLSVARSAMELSNSTLNSSTAGEGGSVFAEDQSTLSVQNVSIEYSNALDVGGGFRILSQSSLTFRNSVASNNAAAREAGSINCRNESRCDILNSHLTLSSSGFGAALSVVVNSSGSLVDSLISNNTATYSGGSVYVSDSILSIERSTFQNGTARSGGAFFSTQKAIVQISHSDFSLGSAERGGAMRLNGQSQLSVENTSMVGNIATVNGGAIYVYDSNATVINSNFTRNRAVEGGGGGMYTRTGSTLIVSNVVFSNNTAGSGGAVSLSYNSTGNVSDSSFSHNSADRGGGAWHIQEANLTMSRCSISNCNSGLSGGAAYIARSAVVDMKQLKIQNGRSQYGGGITCSSGSVCRIKNATVENCLATKRGGAIYVSEAELQANNSVMLNNTAEEDGGAIEVKNSNFTGDGLALTNNSAASNGGGIYCRLLGNFWLEESQFSDNKAKNGGAMSLDTNVTATLRSVGFANNSATETGGSSYIKESKAQFEGCWMELCRARWGGCLFVSNSSVNATDLRLENSAVTENGGFIYAETNTSMAVKNVTMRRGTAERSGGAVGTRNSTFEAQSLEVSGCSAGEDGGALFANGTSTILCLGCLVEDNIAEGRGGAISFESISTQLLAVQLDRSVLRNNTAEFGGGLHFVSSDRTVNCSLPEANCTYAVFRQTRVAKNGAARAGGAIFSNDLSVIRVDCESASDDSEPQFLNRSLWEPMNKLSTLDSVCQTWGGNTAGEYGRDIASYGRFVRKMAIHEETDEAEEIEGNEFVVHQHRSGDPLPVLVLQVVDELNQGPIVGVNSDVIRAVMTSPDGFFAGSVAVELPGGVGNFTSVSGFREPGNYTMKVSFSEESLEPFSFVVNIRECTLGEHSARNGLFCERCSGDTYVLNPQDECRPCPDHAECDSMAIRPEEGYWHSTLCSTRLQRCLSRRACDFEGRDETLRIMEGELETCDFNPEAAANYTDAQCDEGYTGPLCGSCQTDYGRSQSFYCEACFTGFGNFVLVLLSIVVLIALTLVPLRSNLASKRKPFVSARPVQNGTCEEASTSMPPVVVNLEMMEVHCTEKAPADATGAGTHTSVKRREGEDSAEILKWKAAEMFKITVNFVQVTSTAITLNVEWTATLVTFFEAAEFISGVSSEAVNRSVDCMVSSNSAIERSVISSIIDVSVPVIVVGLFAAFWLAVRIRYGHTNTYAVQRIVLSAIAVLYISYISITKTLVNTLNCVDVYDSVEEDNDSQTSYWAVDTGLECYSGSHAVLASTLGWPLLVLFSWGFPVCLAYLTVRNVQQDYKQGWIYSVSGFVYRAYRRRFVYWESVVMLRKALLAVVVVFSYPLGPTLQGILSVLVMAIALYFQTVCRPYREEFSILNEMEGVSILVSLVTFVSSLFFLDSVVPDYGHIVVTAAIVLCNTVVLFFFIAYILLFAAQYSRTLLNQENVVFDPNRGTLYVLRVTVSHFVFSAIKDGAHNLSDLLRGSSTNQGRK